MGRLSRELARVIEVVLEGGGHADESHLDGLGHVEAEARAKLIGDCPFAKKEVHELDGLELVLQAQVARQVIAAIEDVRGRSGTSSWVARFTWTTHISSGSGPGPK